MDDCKLNFSNALDFTDRLERDYEERFDSAMQYISSNDRILDVLAEATKRTTCTRTLQAEADSCGELAAIASVNGIFQDMIDGTKKKAYWCLRILQMDRECPSKKLAIQATNEITEMLQMVSFILRYSNLISRLSFVSMRYFWRLSLVVKLI